MAHIMTYEELCKLKRGDSVYEEFKESRNSKIIELQFNGLDLSTNGLEWRDADHYLLLSECDEEDCPDYNWHYRVWNEMPAEEEINKTPWKDDPYKE